MHLNEISDYWNKRAEGYSLSVNEEFGNEVRDMWIKKFNQYRPIPDKMKCMELGCGPGFLSILLALNGNDVTGIDCSDEMLARAWSNAEKMGVKPEFRNMDMHSPEFSDDTFDFIVSRNVTWLLEDPQKAYSEWLRILKPGGRIVINDGNHYLHYFDKTYEKFRELKKKELGDKPHRNMLGVDSKPIDDLARDLPLSKVERPAWDVDCLIKCGAAEVNVVPSLGRLKDENGKEVKVITHFDICITKK